MNAFETTLNQLLEEAEVIRKQEATINLAKGMFHDKMMGFLKEAGLPKDFTLPELMSLSVRKSRESIIIP